MSKFDEDRLYELRHKLETELPQVVIYTDIEGTYLHIIYNGESVCKTLLQKRDGYSIEFEREFVFDYHPSITWRSTSDGVVSCIRSRIRYYDEKKGQEVKNMINRRFIVEKMEVEQKCCEPDVINMTIRKSPDGIDGPTARKLKTLIESIDPDKLCSDYRIDVNIDNNTVNKVMYRILARGNGKTRYISELLKNSFPFKDHIKDVIFNDPATIVFWTDGTKTVVRCQPGETFDPEKGLAMAISKRMLGNDYGYYETFAKYVGRYNKQRGKKDET